MFPPIEPFATGYLPVTDRNEIYWETSGNPLGKPALHLHGGPGGGNKGGYRRRFNPEKYFIVSFDQRGCGRSRPRATDAGADLSTNTTAALISDIELLREHLRINRWLVSGVSWGTTLALAYAQSNPDRVSEIALMAINTTTRFEVDWITEQMRHLFPQQWEQFAAAVEVKAGQRLIDAYYDLITHRDPIQRAKAADAWCTWEDVHVSLEPNRAPDSSFRDPQYRLVFATLVIHYWKNAGFLQEGEILAKLPRIAHLPAVLIHGRWDVSSPSRTAWNLHRAWPGSELVIVDDEGHGGEKMIAALVRAIERFSCL